MSAGDARSNSRHFDANTAGSARGRATGGASRHGLSLLCYGRERAYGAPATHDLNKSQNVAGGSKKNATNTHRLHWTLNKTGNVSVRSEHARRIGFDRHCRQPPCRPIQIIANSRLLRLKCSECSRSSKEPASRWPVLAPRPIPFMFHIMKPLSSTKSRDFSHFSRSERE